MTNFTEKQKKIRENYKKKYGKEMPLPKSLKDRWKEQPLTYEKIKNKGTSK